jgi:hypothetical protein
MPDYGKVLDFYRLNQEAARLAFETAKYSPFLFMLAPAVNPPVEPWQPLLFDSFPNNSVPGTPVLPADVLTEG